MATGKSAQPRRGVEVTPLTPVANVDTGEAQLWGSLGQLSDQLVEANKAQQVQRAQTAGAEEGRDAWAKGEAAPSGGVFAFGDVYEARQAAVERSYRAGVENDWDAAETEVAARNTHSVEAYEREMAALRSSFIEKADPRFAVAIETYATRRITAGRSQIVDRVQSVQLQEAALNIAGRYGSLTTQMVDLARSGRTDSVEYKLLEVDRRELQAERLANPALPYGEAQAAEDEREFNVAAKAAIYTHHAVDVLRTEGADAALATLQGMLTDPDLQPGEVQPAFEQARAGLNQEIDLATDRANVARSTRTRAEQEIDRRIEEDAGAAELGLPSTGLTEAEVMAVKGPAGVAEWYRKRAEALERNRLTGSLAGLTPEEAAARIADAQDAASASGDFEPIVNWIIDDSEGTALVANDNGAGRARFGITERSHPEAWRDGDVTRQEAVAIYKREYWDAIGADGLAKDLRIVAFDAAINHGAGLARRWIEESGGDAARYIELRRNHYNALARSNPAKYGDDLRGWMNRLDAVTTRVQAMGAGNLIAQQYTNAREGFSSDPHQFATTHRLSAPISLNVDAVFTAGAAREQWGQALRARATLGQELATDRQVPLRYFTNGEVAAYRDRFERDPGAAVEFAEAATRALGGRGARNALAEVGQDTEASTAIHIADLSTGGDTRFADQAAHGLTLKAAGQSLDKERRDEIAEYFAAHRVSFRNAPSLSNAIVSAAEAAALADYAAGDVNRPASYYVQAALGRSTWQGRRYGGTTDINGDSTLLPRWLNPEYADEALEALAENWVTHNQGPVYGNDTPIPAREIARMRLVVMSNGNYRLVDRRSDRVAYDRQGRVFELNLGTEEGREFLNRRLGNSGVRPD